MNQTRVIQHACGCFVYVHNECRVSLPVERLQHLRRQLFARLGADDIVRDTVKRKKLLKPCPKASSVHQNHPIRRGKRIHNRRFHGRSSGSRYEYGAGVLRRFGKLQDPTFVFKHDLRKFRRSEIRNLFRSDPAHAFV